MRIRRLALCAFLAVLALPAHGAGGDSSRLWWLAAGTGGLAAIATLASMVMVLRNLVRETRGRAEAARGTALAEATSACERRLTEVAERLSRELSRRAETLAEHLRKTPGEEAESLPIHAVPGAGAESRHLLGREISALADAERQRLGSALEAAGLLGDWIEGLWPVLRSVAGGDAGAVAGELPHPAAAEWRSAHRVLHDFCRLDARALRRLGRRAAGGNGSAGGGTLPAGASPDAAFLDRAGLLAGERPLGERLKRYLEPFDHLGRLGEVTLALQYLLEAYPIEQLARDQRSRLRGELAARIAGAGLEPDFHLLVKHVAAGVGLRYRPVRYYQSRTDQSDYAFVRQQVSPISLSERVGFDATVERPVIVRLERPFFAQTRTGIYHAGHAHVAR